MRLYNKEEFKEYRKRLRFNMPEPERLLWYRLKGKGLEGKKFRRQYSVGNYILDFYCVSERLAVELDGDSYYESGSRESDQNRDMFLKKENIKVLRFTNTDVCKNIDAVLGKILDVINKTETPPNLPL